MTAVPLVADGSDCWNRIGVRGDRSCPELARVGHCHNCEVFAAAGRRFLDADSPPGYVDEWTERLAAPLEEAAANLASVLTFRLGDEWLALPVGVLAEVTGTRPVHCVPFRGGILRGIVNIRGELHLCVNLAGLLGISPTVLPGPGNGDSAARRPAGASTNNGGPMLERLLVLQREHERWVCPVDEVGQVHRFADAELRPSPTTVARAEARLTRGIVTWEGRPVGVLDDKRLFDALRVKLR